MCETQKKPFPPEHLIWLLTVIPWFLCIVLTLFAPPVFGLLVIPILNFILVYMDGKLCGEYNYFIGTAVVIIGLIIPVIYPLIRLLKTSKNMIPVVVQCFAIVITIAVLGHFWWMWY